jgi:flagellar hook-associated protein 3 FlgL
MLNRVATSTQTTRMMEHLQSSSSSLSEIEGQVASGKRIQQVSDDPTSAISALAQRAELTQTTQYTRNANDATDWLNTTDSALSSVVTALQSARTSLVQAQSGGLDSASRAAIYHSSRRRCRRCWRPPTRRDWDDRSSPAPRG